MSDVIKVENLSKAYQLGSIGTGTISRDLERFWAKMRGKDDPFLKIGEENDRTKKGKSDIVWSLKDMSFDVKQGDAVGIIGRNGAGKSTLLKILSRVTAPTTGSIKVKGRVASLLEVGTGFHPELTGRENIFLNGAILGMRKSEIREKFDEMVDFAGVERYIDTPVKKYSSGMYVRLAFAVAAYLESEILIVDEVLAVGDAEFQKKCLGKMSDISQGQGRTVLFVSHNMDSIRKLCSSCIYLKNGSLSLQSSTQQAISSYLSDSDEQSNKRHVVEDINQYVKLINFQLSKNTFQVNDDIDFLIELKSHLNNGVKGLSILVYNNLESRVAIVDLRNEDLFKTSRRKNHLYIEGTIKKFNFLPGTYSFGLYLDSEFCTGDFLNIAYINIEERITPNAILPYPKEVRGMVFFNHTFTIK